MAFKNRLLKQLILLAPFYLASVLSLAANPIPKKIHRILFLGNSITYAGQYITDIEACYVARYPKQHIEFINAGLSSETVSGLSEPGHAGGSFPRPDLHERLQRVLDQTKPDLVFACYGMNDGIYMPFDQERFQKFKDGINWLHEQVLRAGAKIIHITPPVYDELKGRSIGYGAVLDQYSNWLIGQRKAAKWEVADLHFPMKKYLEDHRKTNPSFAFASDGVHPNDLGHWIMAKQILMHLGVKGLDKAEDIKTALGSGADKEQLLTLISKRQNIMKDAWLTSTGHKRPGVKPGIPLNEAKTKAEEIEKEIRLLLK